MTARPKRSSRTRTPTSAAWDTTSTRYTACSKQWVNLFPAASPTPPGGPTGVRSPGRWSWPTAPAGTTPGSSSSGSASTARRSPSTSRTRFAHSSSPRPGSSRRRPATSGARPTPSIDRFAASSPTARHSGRSSCISTPASPKQSRAARRRSRPGWTCSSSRRCSPPLPPATQLRRARSRPDEGSPPRPAALRADRRP